MPRKVQSKPRRHKEAKRIGRARRIPDIKPGRYADGLPLNEVQYLECKIILRPNHFTSRRSFFDFAKVMRRPAEEAGVDFTHRRLRRPAAADPRGAVPGYRGLPAVQQRVHPAPTHPLCGRVPGRRPRDRLQVSSPEHPASRGDGRATAASRATIGSSSRSRRCPLKDRLGGMRLLFSHNVQFGLSAVEEGDHTSLETIVHMLPALSSLKRSRGEKVELVGDTIVEEVLQNIGTLDFGAGIARGRQRGAMALARRPPPAHRGIRL